MNILMMTNTYFPLTGGLEKSIAAFSGEFRRRGHKVLIVSPEFKGSRKKEYGVVRVPAIQNFNGTDFSVSLPIPGLVSKLVDSFRPDIIHAHHPFLMGDMALRLAGQYQIPLIFTHHTLFEQYTDYFPLNTEAGKNFVIEMGTGYANLADHVIAPSESVRELLMERGVTSHVWVVPTGVNIKAFARGAGAKFRRNMKIPAGAFVAGYAGRVAPEKNLEFLARAAADFLKKEKKAWFLAVGRGPSEGEMKKIFREAEVMGRVRFAGVLRGQKLVDAYHAMDAFAFASQSETQGMVITEAMAAGVPVVALDGPGVREVVRDRKNGRLLSAEKRSLFPDALAWVMKRTAAQKKQMREEMARTAREFSIENSADKALRLYEKTRSRKQETCAAGCSPWQLVMERIKREWEMLANLGKAAGSAVSAEVLKSAESGAAPLEKEADAPCVLKGALAMIPSYEGCQGSAN